MSLGVTKCWVGFNRCPERLIRYQDGFTRCQKGVNRFQEMLIGVRNVLIGVERCY